MQKTKRLASSIILAPKMASSFERCHGGNSASNTFIISKLARLRSQIKSFVAKARPIAAVSTMVSKYMCIIWGNHHFGMCQSLSYFGFEYKPFLVWSKATGCEPSDFCLNSKKVKKSTASSFATPFQVESEKSKHFVVVIIIQHYHPASSNRAEIFSSCPSPSLPLNVHATTYYRWWSA